MKRIATTTRLALACIALAGCGPARPSGGGDGGTRASSVTKQATGKAADQAAAARSAGDSGPDDFSYWVARAGSQDCSAAASNGEARAQLLYGLSLVRDDLVIVQDSVPHLSSIPVIGKLLFEKTRYVIDERADPGQVAAAHQWVTRARDQHFAPALEAEKLFRGRAEAQGPSAPAGNRAGSGT